MGPPQRPFYSVLNEKLRSRNRRRELTPWFAHLRLFINALSKLPNSKHRIIYRGVKLDLGSDYSKDINRHSFFPEQKEVLLYSTRQFRVNSSLDVGSELHIIHLEEIESPFPLIQIPSAIGNSGLGSNIKHTKTLSTAE
ncbi:unnamed protein product [Rotaria socialis]|uniref:NAD(+)--protein-arginine ADP-ribosyltransferase n=1 Tax=Rotaria socialis TaxID=392032 RepID=A0A820XXP7_9BILA|nr:unnamed protein product [Rotaria socialis]CAF4539166.1 unnamed protein product [Rotaria socialis]